MKPESAAPRTLRTLEQFAQRHPAFTVGGLRWLRFNCESNGYGTAFRVVGRRVLIDEDAFFAAVDRLNGVEERKSARPAHREAAAVNAGRGLEVDPASL